MKEIFLFFIDYLRKQVTHKSARGIDGLRKQLIAEFKVFGRFINACMSEINRQEWDSVIKMPSFPFGLCKRFKRKHMAHAMQAWTTLVFLPVIGLNAIITKNVLKSVLY